MAYAATSSSITSRMMRAARLEVPLYEEVEADTTATSQALTVVLLVAVASGLGAAIGAAITGNSSALVARLIGGVLNALIGWAVWSYVLYFVGTRFFGGTATYGELLRTLGFAESPSVLLILSFVPVLGGILALVVGIWTLVASFIATRQALDIDNTKTVFTIIVGVVALFIVFAIVAALLALVFGAGAAAGRLF
ncbi:MAG TPA: Yip1 family protein [Chloroflexota bacterium]|nr:Yip1 family protein [Chloroflexota bacterium]